MRNVQLNLKWNPVLTAFDLWITAEDEEGHNMRLVLDPEPVWENYSPATYIESTLRMAKETMYSLHRELNYYGPHKDEKPPPDMEQLEWLRGLVEKKLFE